ncbi:MAG: hypothetical protein QOH77_795, partial [Actinomycetota bacterium]|nr:hypothetical protein [Actinomycetota bacterium]
MGARRGAVIGSDSGVPVVTIRVLGIDPGLTR